MPELHELQATRKNLLEQARAINEKAKAEKRDLTAEEQTNYNKYFDEAQNLKSKIDQELRQRDVDRELAELDARATRPVGGDGAELKSVVETSREYRGLWLANTYHEQRSKSGRVKLNGLNDEQRKRMNALEDALNQTGYYRAWSKAMAFGVAELSSAERRDLMMGSDPAGGFLVPP